MSVPTASEPDEELAGGGLPRWLAVAAAAVTALVLVTVGVRALHRPAVVAGRPHALPPLLAATPDPSAAMLLDGAFRISVTAGTLQVVGGRTSSVLGARPLAAQALVAQAGVSLVADPAADAVWTVPIGAAPTRLAEYRLPRLQPLRQVSWPYPVGSAAVLGGYLYLGTPLGVQEVAPPGEGAAGEPGAGAVLPVAGLEGAVGAVAADPGRRRLIATDAGYPTDLWTYRRGAVPVEAGTPIALAGATIAVTPAGLWAAGSGGSRAALVRLDPGTLAPIATAQLPTSFGARAVIVAAGTAAMYLRPDIGGPALFCVPTASGQAVQRWQAAGGVASASGRAYLAGVRGVQRLPLGQCPG